MTMVVAVDLKSNKEAKATKINDNEAKDPTGDVWVMHGKHNLNFIDKAAIEQDQELND